MYVSRKPKPCVDCGGPVEIDHAWRAKRGACHSCSDREVARRHGEASAAQRRRYREANQAAWARRKALERFRTTEEAGLRAAASAFVHKAVRYGFLPPITPETRCVDCGKQATLYEHRDYSRPLDVEPVCNACNCSRGKGQMPPRVSLDSA